VADGTYRLVNGRLKVQIEDLLGTDTLGGWVYQGPGQGNNPGAEGAHYYYRSQELDGSNSRVPQEGRFSFTFEVETAGQYSILLRAARDTNDPGDSRNDVWIRVDDDTEAVMPAGNNPLDPGGEGFVKFKGGLGLTWRDANQFSTPDETDNNARSTVVLAAGTHTITFAPRSVGIHVDSVSVIAIGAPETPFAATIPGTELADRILGFDGREHLIGFEGNDTLVGGAGADRMEGGLGDDTFFFDNRGDVLVERAGEGVDTVVSTLTMTLGAQFENLTLIGNAVEGNGNDAGNMLIGNALGNVLRGGLGNDVLDGRAGADLMDGGEGSDTYVVDNALDRIVETTDPGVDTVLSAVSYALAPLVENLVLTGAALRGFGNAGDNRIVGNTLANELRGGDGADTLAGGAGGDRMFGGAGNDSYVVDTALDQALEAAGQGWDSVLTSVSHALGANVETATAIGVGAVNLVGNALGNVLRGNDAANVLSGGLGRDVLLGGGGADVFKFAAAAESLASPARDTIGDFVRGLDRIDLSGIDADPFTAGDQAFGFVGARGFLGVAGELRFANGAVQADIDGDGRADLQIAVSGIAALAASDFLL
jgi:Ca2+-binding RTX toxin-like protein